MKINSKNKKDNFLLYIPRKNHDNWVEKEGDIYLVFTHDKIIEKLIQKLFNKPRVTDIRLDEIGTYIWQLIDDNRNIYNIGQCLVERYGKKCEPVYDRLIMYLRYLNKKGWIRFRKEEYSKI
ncbi:PqqD family protein [Proteiniborus sp.]|uniref:PqqD family protein n=1 Tax=Proteiniborus sp. TaxID=2079015 RepID=UPI00332A28F2